MNPSFDMSILRMSNISIDHVGYPYGMDTCISNAAKWYASLSRWYVYQLFEVYHSISGIYSDPIKLMYHIHNPIHYEEMERIIRKRFNELEEYIDRNNKIIEARNTASIPYIFDFERFRYNLITSGMLLMPLSAIHMKSIY